MHDEHVVHRRVETLVLAVRPFVDALVGQYLALDDHLGVGGDEQVAVEALHDLDGLALQRAREGVLGVLYLVRVHERTRGVGERGVHADGERDRSRLPLRLVHEDVGLPAVAGLRGVLADLVAAARLQGERLVVEDHAAIEPLVDVAGLGVHRRDACSRADVASGIPLVPPRDGQLVQVHVLPGDNLLLADRLRHLHRSDGTLPRLPDAFVERHVVRFGADSQRELLRLGEDVRYHPLARVAIDVLEEQPHEAVAALVEPARRDASDLVVEIDRCGDVLEQAVLLQDAEVVPQVLVIDVRHFASSSGASRAYPARRYYRAGVDRSSKAIVAQFRTAIPLTSYEYRLPPGVGGRYILTP